MKEGHKLQARVDTVPLPAPHSPHSPGLDPGDPGAGLPPRNGEQTHRPATLLSFPAPSLLSKWMGPRDDLACEQRAETGV